VIKHFVVLVVLSLGVSVLAGDAVAFQKKDRHIDGSFEIRDIAGTKTLVFSKDFKTKSGPDLKILLSPMAFSDTNGRNATKGAVTLGLLKSTKGSQTYVIPKHVDLSSMKSVLIHCVKYSKLWGGGSIAH
jgi:hypothetical protein